MKAGEGEKGPQAGVYLFICLFIYSVILKPTMMTHAMLQFFDGNALGDTMLISLRIT